MIPAADLITEPSLLPRLALAVVVICTCAYAAGIGARRLGQARVIGEIAAGLVLGPTLLGLTLPGVEQFVFPHALSGTLDALATLGVILFVFFIGVEFRPALLRGRRGVLAAVTASSFAVPLALGAAIAFPLYSRFGGEEHDRTAFVLFLGVALSITAVPVLAAIVDDLGLGGHPLATLALGSAVATDLAAWCLLAIVAAEAGSDSTGGVLVRVVGALAFGCVLLGVTPLLRRSFATLPAFLYALAAGAFAYGAARATERIGVGVIFGAFGAGLVFGAGRAFGLQSENREWWLGRVRAVNRWLLLPIFFVATGLRVDLHSSGAAHLAVAGVLVLALVSVAKVGGVSLASRAMGIGRRDSLGLGFLLNTKGLTEIVVLRLGYDLGLLSRDALGVMIVVALLTTAATVPALRLLGIGTPRIAEMPAQSDLGA